jgi:hypothetical protein
LIKEAIMAKEKTKKAKQGSKKGNEVEKHAPQSQPFPSSGSAPLLGAWRS